MTASGWEWLAVAAVLAVLDWITVAVRARWLERWLKPATLGCLVVAAVLGRPHHAGVHGWLVAALVLGLLGDLALVLPDEPAHRPAGLVPAGASRTAQAGRPFEAGRIAEPGRAVGIPNPDQPAELARPGTGAHRPAPEQSERFFLLGLLSFLIGHICYSMAMLRFGVDPLSVGFGLILMLLAVFAFGYRIIAGGHQAGGALLSSGITCYIVALGSAVMLGVGTTRLLIAGGILLFAASDLVLAGDRFVRSRPYSALVVVVLYHCGQALLLIGLLR
ncbi:MAG TPA: lysoplasmalogenase family protein [Jatrophihabitans sp.]|nr:lysoplasmalogenase family protein [Jatrophihabitans sp.]